MHVSKLNIPQLKNVPINFQVPQQEVELTQVLQLEISWMQVAISCD